MTSDNPNPPPKNHNKGPIGPLDPPPYNPRGRRIYFAKDAVEALRALGVDITERKLEYYHSIGQGPWHTAAPGQRRYALGDIYNWAAVTFPVPVMNRKQATKYICEELGYPIGPTVLSQLIYTKSKGPRYVKLGRDTYYTEEACEKWVEEMEATGPRRSTKPKYLPLYAKRRCPEGVDIADLLKHFSASTLYALWGGKEPPPEHKGCPFIKHENCAKFPRALCNLVHLPPDPDLYEAYKARGIIRLLCYRRPDATQIQIYLAAWGQRFPGPGGKAY